MRIKKLIGRSILVLLFILMIVVLVNGQNEEVTIDEEVETEAEVEISESQELVPSATNLDVFLIDRIHGSQIKLKNCILSLAGEMRIAEDNFTYNNTFVNGDMYKITVLIELKED